MRRLPDYFGFRPHVRVAARRQRASGDLARLRQRDGAVQPVVIEGRTIAHTFWGQGWCRNLERYSDYSNRLPRGRTYVRNGSVVDLQVAAGAVLARVSGSALYTVKVAVDAVAPPRWKALCRACAGGIDSLVALLQGQLSASVMERLCAEKTGLFPSPQEIRFSCSCPDWASMCKHVAAVLYGIGARLDTAPELLFLLRGVDQVDLVARAGQVLPGGGERIGAHRLLVQDGLGELFGIDLAEAAPAPRRRKAAPSRRR